MFSSKTLFVLGAGASHEVGLPVGTGLLTQINTLLNIKYEMGRRQTSGDTMIVEALKIILDEKGAVDLLNGHLKAGQQIIKSSTQAISIDNIIDALQDDRVALVGKLAIARAIHLAERQSSFFSTGSDPHADIKLSGFSGTWYDSFTKLLTESIRYDNLDIMFDNIQIISFNYDRCIEHYLPYSIGNYYGLRPLDVQSAIPGLKIHRPYGIVGALPWLSMGEKGVPFGGGTVEDLVRCSSQVRTFTEQVVEGSELDAIHNAINWADTIVFLGFAYNKQNLKLLKVNTGMRKRVVGTAVAISSLDQLEIKHELIEIFGLENNVNDNIYIAPIPCAQLFKDYSRLISG